MAIALEVVDLNSQVIDAILDGETFYIVLNWNDASSNWTFGVRNANYDAVILGVSLVPNYPLTKQFRYHQLWRGELGVLTPKFRNGPIPRDGFLTGEYELVYVPEAELNVI